MKLGVVCHGRVGGSGVIATELALHLADRGHQVTVLAPSTPVRFRAHPNVRLQLVSAPPHPLFPHGELTWAFASAMHGLEVDVLHVHYAIPFLGSALLGSRAPVVVTLHGTDALTVGKEPAYRAVLHDGLHRVAAITAPSRFLADDVRATFGTGEVHVIHNFIDVTRFTPGPRRVTPKVLTHASNFRSVKRVDDVISVFARVRRSQACVLELIGDGPAMSEVEQLVERAGLGEHVRFHGEVHDVVPVLQRSHVFLLPSELESFGLAALEAMACGVPVVASRVGGIPEVVEHGRSGFLHPVGDVDAMTHSTLRLLEDETFHEAMAIEARLSAEARFRHGPIVDHWEALYASVMRSKR